MARISELAVKLVAVLKSTENRAANLSDQLDEAASRRRIRDLTLMMSKLRGSNGAVIDNEGRRGNMNFYNHHMWMAPKELRMAEDSLRRR